MNRTSEDLRRRLGLSNFGYLKFRRWLYKVHKTGTTDRRKKAEREPTSFSIGGVYGNCGARMIVQLQTPQERLGNLDHVLTDTPSRKFWYYETYFGRKKLYVLGGHENRLLREYQQIEGSSAREPINIGSIYHALCYYKDQKEVIERLDTGGGAFTAFCTDGLMAIVQDNSCSGGKAVLDSSKEWDKWKRNPPTTLSGRFIAPINTVRPMNNMGGVTSTTHCDTVEEARLAAFKNVKPGTIEFISGVHRARNSREERKNSPYGGSMATSALLHSTPCTWKEIAPGLWDYCTAPNVCNPVYDGRTRAGASYLHFIYKSKKGEAPPKVTVTRVTFKGGKRNEDVL